VQLTSATSNAAPRRAGPPVPPDLNALTRELGLLYGCDYNPEQWPREVWHEDVALMRAAAVNLVTVGVFSWALLEPRPGEFELDWLGDVLDLLQASGIAVDLATPTASPPAWLSVRWPETRAVTADGVRLSHGSRNHFCPSSPVYRDRALTIAGALVDRFASHPAVRMWHIGNEYGQVCHCNLCGAEFRAWLRRRYGTLGELNRAWGTTFWSQRYDDWAEVIPPRAAPYLINPTQTLDYRRFASDQLLALYLEQRELVRRATPATPVTTNFMGFHPITDYWRWAPEVDVVADDSYGDPADDDSPLRQSLAHDLMRGLAGGMPWMLMEQAASAVNWRPHNLPKTPAGCGWTRSGRSPMGRTGPASSNGASPPSVPSASTRHSSRTPDPTPGCTAQCARTAPSCAFWTASSARGSRRASGSPLTGRAGGRSRSGPLQATGCGSWTSC